MRKSHKHLLFLFSLFICLIAISDVAPQTPLKTDEGVQDVILDKTEAVLACPGAVTISRSGICSEENRKIKISTLSTEAEKKGLDFYYLVSGGKIVGHGKNVIWDLSEVRAEKYLVAVGIGKNGILQGNLVTKTVSVVECECTIPCECPTGIIVSTPTELIKAGDTITFTANISGGSQQSTTFNWTVTDGKITEGQGTSQILVKTTKEMKGQTITATVEVGGLCVACPRSASASAEIKEK